MIQIFFSRLRLPLVVFLGVLTYHCASTKVTIYSFEHKLLTEADSLFQAGQYEPARMKYLKIRAEYPQTSAAANAQYKLGYLNIYHGNPRADYNLALQEFKKYVTDYPEHHRVSSAQNWIRMLSILQNFSRSYHGNARKLNELKGKQDAIFQNYDTVQEAYLRCDSVNDSLKQRIKVLEALIQELDKIK